MSIDPTGGSSPTSPTPPPTVPGGAPQQTGPTDTVSSAATQITAEDLLKENPVLIPPRDGDVPLITDFSEIATIIQQFREELYNIDVTSPLLEKGLRLALGLSAFGLRSQRRVIAEAGTIEDNQVKAVNQLVDNINQTIAAHNAKIPADNQEIQKLNDGTITVAQYNSYAQQRNSEIDTYNAAIDQYNSDIQTAIATLNESRKALGLSELQEGVDYKLLNHAPKMPIVPLPSPPVASVSKVNVQITPISTSALPQVGTPPATDPLIVSANQAITTMNNAISAYNSAVDTINAEITKVNNGTITVASYNTAVTTFNNAVTTYNNALDAYNKTMIDGDPGATPPVLGLVDQINNKRAAQTPPLTPPISVIIPPPVSTTLSPLPPPNISDTMPTQPKAVTTTLQEALFNSINQLVNDINVQIADHNTKVAQDNDEIQKLNDGTITIDQYNTYVQQRNPEIDAFNDLIDTFNSELQSEVTQLNGIRSDLGLPPMVEGIDYKLLSHAPKMTTQTKPGPVSPIPAAPSALPAFSVGTPPDTDPLVVGVNNAITTLNQATSTYSSAITAMNQAVTDMNNGSISIKQFNAAVDTFNAAVTTYNDAIASYTTALLGEGSNPGFISQINDARAAEDPPLAPLVEGVDYTIPTSISTSQVAKLQEPNKPLQPTEEIEAVNTQQQASVDEINQLVDNINTQIDAYNAEVAQDNQMIKDVNDGTITIDAYNAYVADRNTQISSLNQAINQYNTNIQNAVDQLNTIRRGIGLADLKIGDDYTILDTVDTMPTASGPSDLPIKFTASESDSADSVSVDTSNDPINTFWGPIADNQLEFIQEMITKLRLVNRGIDFKQRILRNFSILAPNAVLDNAPTLFFDISFGTGASVIGGALPLGLHSAAFGEAINRGAFQAISQQYRVPITDPGFDAFQVLAVQALQQIGFATAGPTLGLLGNRLSNLSPDSPAIQVAFGATLFGSIRRLIDAETFGPALNQVVQEAVHGASLPQGEVAKLQRGISAAFNLTILGVALARVFSEELRTAGVVPNTLVGALGTEFRNLFISSAAGFSFADLKNSPLTAALVKQSLAERLNQLPQFTLEESQQIANDGVNNVGNVQNRSQFQSALQQQLIRSGISDEDASGLSALTAEVLNSEVRLPFLDTPFESQAFNQNAFLSSVATVQDRGILVQVLGVAIQTTAASADPSQRILRDTLRLALEGQGANPLQALALANQAATFSATGAPSVRFPVDALQVPALEGSITRSLLDRGLDFESATSFASVATTSTLERAGREESITGEPLSQERLRAFVRDAVLQQGQRVGIDLKAHETQQIADETVLATVPSLAGVNPLSVQQIETPLSVGEIAENLSSLLIDGVSRDLGEQGAKQLVNQLLEELFGTSSLQELRELDQAPGGSFLGQFQQAARDLRDAGIPVGVIMSNVEELMLKNEIVGIAVKAAIDPTLLEWSLGPESRVKRSVDLPA